MAAIRELPAPPEVPEAQRGAGDFSIRFEDVAQDGRFKLEPVTNALGATLWWRAGDHPLIRALTNEGIFPILARLYMEAGGGPISARSKVQGRGAYELYETTDSNARKRYRMDVTSELTGVIGVTFGKTPKHAGEPVVLGRVVAEHVLTRPFADEEERNVESLPSSLLEGIEVKKGAWHPPAEAMMLPAGAEPIDDAFALDACPIVFGLGHTDSNQHVNSLVYPRLLEEAALRRFHSHEKPTRLLPRYADIAFRKPCFAGDRMRIAVRAYKKGDELGIVGAFISASEALTFGHKPSERAHCFARMVFSP